MAEAMTEMALAVHEAPVAQTRLDAVMDASGAVPAAARTGTADGASPAPAAWGAWPADWREQMAAGDDKALKRLARYRTPDGVVKALLAADQKINSGALLERAPFPAEGSAAEQATWRRANDVPEAAEGYHGRLDGIVIGSADRPLIDDFLSVAHAGHQTAAQVRDTIDWYYRTQEMLAADKAEADRAFRAEAEAALRADMGPEFRRNMQDLRTWFATGSGGDGAGEDTSLPDLLFGARLADGTLLGDNPRVLRFLTAAMREINPVATVVPGTGTDSLATLNEEILAIEKRIREDRKGYHADGEMKTRYRELLGARDRAARRRG